MASDSSLPTWPEIETRALAHLAAALSELAEAQSWLRSDWHPAGSSLTDAQDGRRSEVQRIAAEAKGLLDQAKRVLYGEEAGNGE